MILLGTFNCIVASIICLLVGNILAAVGFLIAAIAGFGWYLKVKENKEGMERLHQYERYIS